MKFLALSFLLLFKLVFTHGDSPHIFQTLKEVCANIDKSPEAQRVTQATQKCSDQYLPKRDLESIRNCKALMNYDSAEEMSKICGDQKKNEKKFQELKSCLLKNLPDSVYEEQINACIQAAGF